MPQSIFNICFFYSTPIPIFRAQALITFARSYALISLLAVSYHLPPFIPLLTLYACLIHTDYQIDYLTDRNADFLPLQIYIPVLAMNTLYLIKMDSVPEKALGIFIFIFGLCCTLGKEYQLLHENL